MKKILLIGTGGTIASVETDRGLVPELTGEALTRAVPELLDLCEIDCLQLLSKDSTSICPEDWVLMAETIRRHYVDYDGFLIAHGTDTMAYTAAALSYLVQNNRKPIVLTGSQLPMVSNNADAARNLLDACICACDPGSTGTQIVFSGSVILGTRARKNFTKRFAAFGSINFPEIARIQGGRLTRFISLMPTDDLRFYDRLDTNVGLLKLVPGMKGDVMRYVIDRHDGLVVETFGVGGLPEYTDFYGQLKSAVDAGKLIVMTTQVPNEGSDLAVYGVGHAIKQQLNVLEAHDMTTEAAYAKLMWILGETHDFAEAERLFYAPVLKDIMYF